MSSFHYLTMYLNSFVPKTKHNCGCISQVCIYKGIFRFWSALCGLLGDKCSIASSCLVHKTSTVHMAFFNSLRGAKQLLREANNPRNGAKQILRDSKHLLRETKQILRDSKQLLRETNKPSNGAKYKASKPHFSKVYDDRTSFILKSTNYFETNNASTKIVPRIDFKKGYSYHVSNQPKVSAGPLV